MKFHFSIIFFWDLVYFQVRALCFQLFELFFLLLFLLSPLLSLLLLLMKDSMPYLLVCHFHCLGKSPPCRAPGTRLQATDSSAVQGVTMNFAGHVFPSQLRYASRYLLEILCRNFFRPLSNKKIKKKFQPLSFKLNTAS